MQMEKCPYGYTVPTEFFIRGAKECPFASRNNADLAATANQQIKAEIALLVTKWDALKSVGCTLPRVMYHDFLFEVMSKLRQLSAV